VFVLELAQAAQLTHPQVGVLLLPGVEGRFAHAQLAAHIADRGAALRLAEGIGHLLLGEFRTLHWSPPRLRGPPKLVAYSSFTLPLFSGETSLGPVTLRPLNLEGDNLFAAHRSHSSHSSHSSHQSHRSGSGGSVAPPPTTESPAASPPPGAAPLVPGTIQPTDPSRSAPGSPGTQLTPAEKRKLQIMRVQLALTGLGLYSGRIDGVLGDETKEALKHFQAVKGIAPSGLMTTETLNALGVPAVQ